MTQARTFLFAPAPVLTDPSAAALRADLAGYTTEKLLEVFGEDAYTSYQAEQPTLLSLAANAAWQKTENQQLAGLVKLFMLAETITETELTQIFKTSSETQLLEANLLTVKNGAYQASVKLEPHALQLNDTHYDWWIASDFPTAITGQPLHPQHVLGIGGATKTLLQATPRDRVHRALDLGTGCGILGMYAALHCDEVVATDISERALQIAAFNATLNQVKLSLVQGSLFEPVTGNFDLIMSNPPFVITPDSLRAGGMLEYRDGGQTGDELVGQVVAGAAQHLSPGGVTVMLGNWEIPEGAAPDSHPKSWLTDVETTAWVVQREILPPHAYVEMWLRDNAPAWMRTKAGYESDYANWIADFNMRKVSAVALGLIALHKPTHPQISVQSESPLEVETLPTELNETRGNFAYSEISTGISATGPYIKQVLQELSENNLEIRDTDFFTRAEDVREERHYLPGEPDPQIIIATQGGGFGQRIQLNTHMAATLGACDGELSIGQIVTAISVITGVEHQSVQAAVYGQLPQLILAGMLTRVK
ncbi:MAG: class I SAM-dependent methyltransferase [Actinomycetaceae bacterium]|nr:class I SAM-dependent methyltransferase [Actinomycetaceae bacterium]